MPGDHAYFSDVPGFAELLARQHGLVRRSQLRALGVTGRTVDGQIEARRWRRAAPEVISVDNGRLDRDQVRWLAVLHATTAWLSGRSALEVLGQRGYEPEQVHVLVPRDARPAPLDKVAIHVSDRLTGLGFDLEDGLPIVSPARAVVDAVAWSPHPRVAAGILSDAVRQGIAAPGDIDRELGLAGRIHHKIAARDALAACREGAESMAEVDLGPLLRQAGVTSFRRQVASGSRRTDVEALLADGSVLGLEVDGAAHESAERRWRDAERDARTVAEGKQTLRIPAYAVRREPAAVVTRIRTIVDAARRRAV